MEFWGIFSAIESNGRTIWIIDAHRDDGKRFVVHADEKLTAFVEVESTIRGAASLINHVVEPCGYKAKTCIKIRRCLT